MQIILNTYGSYLQVKDGCFQVKTEDKHCDISVKKISSILITTGAVNERVLLKQGLKP